MVVNWTQHLSGKPGNVRGVARENQGLKWHCGRGDVGLPPHPILDCQKIIRLISIHPKVQNLRLKTLFFLENLEAEFKF